MQCANIVNKVFFGINENTSVLFILLCLWFNFLSYVVFGGISHISKVGCLLHVPRCFLS